MKKSLSIICIGLVISGCSLFNEDSNAKTTNNISLKNESLSNAEKCKLSFNKGLERFKEYIKIADDIFKYYDYVYAYTHKITQQKFSEITRFSEVINDCLPAGLENNAEAQYALGYVYRKIFYNESSPSLGIKANDENKLNDLFGNYFNWYQKAAEQGYAKAQGALARVYLAEGYWDSINKKRILKEDYSKAYSWALKASQQNDIKGLTTLGDLYLYGTGVKQNKTKAYELYKKSSDLGDPRSSWLLAGMFFEGNGVKRNYKAGISMLDRAVKLYDVLGETPNYALLAAKYYDKGDEDWGLKPNKEKAIYYYKIACNYGSTIACNIIR